MRVDRPRDRSKRPGRRGDFTGRQGDRERVGLSSLSTWCLVGHQEMLRISFGKVDLASRLHGPPPNGAPSKLRPETFGRRSTVSTASLKGSSSFEERGASSCWDNSRARTLRTSRRPAMTPVPVLNHLAGRKGGSNSASRVAKRFCEPHVGNGREGSRALFLCLPVNLAFRVPLASAQRESRENAPGSA